VRDGGGEGGSVRTKAFLLWAAHPAMVCAMGACFVFAIFVGSVVLHGVVFGSAPPMWVWIPLVLACGGTCALYRVSILLERERKR
jgi:hypothetical protein